MDSEEKMLYIVRMVNLIQSKYRPNDGGYSDYNHRLAEVLPQFNIPVRYENRTFLVNQKDKSFLENLLWRTNNNAMVESI